MSRSQLDLHSLELELPVDVLQLCSTLEDGRVVDLTATTVNGTELLLHVEKDLSQKIKMIFTDLQKPAADSVLNIWKCHIDSARFGMDTKETTPSQTQTLKLPNSMPQIPQLKKEEIASEEDASVSRRVQKRRRAKMSTKSDVGKCQSNLKVEDVKEEGVKEEHEEVGDAENDSSLSNIEEEDDLDQDDETSSAGLNSESDFQGSCTSKDSVVEEAAEVQPDKDHLSELPLREVCQICQRTFRTKLSLWNHIRTHNLDSYKYLALLQDGKLDTFLKHTQDGSSCDSKTETVEQPRTIRENDADADSSSLSRQNRSSSGTEFLESDHPKNIKSSTSLQCSVCNVRVSRILQHLKWKHSSRSDYAALRDKYSKILQAKHENIHVQCQLCGRKVRRRFLKTHVMRFCQKNPDKISIFKCRRCGYSTMDAEKLDEHHQQKHDPSEVFMCHVCGKSYNHTSSLTRHERVVHKIYKRVPLKRFSCQKCGKSYQLKNQLNVHLVTHTDSATIMCHMCGKMFKRQKAVQYHIKTHHLHLYPYQCQKCGHGMGKRSAFEAHRCDQTKQRPSHTKQRGTTSEDFLPSVSVFNTAMDYPGPGEMTHPSGANLSGDFDIHPTPI